MTDPRKLEGLVPDEVCDLLSTYAQFIHQKYAIVEVGSYKGKSTCCLAAGAREGGRAHVYAVEPWDLPGNVTGRFGFARPETREAFDKQVRKAGLEDHVTPIQAFSVDAAKEWDGPEIGLLYIDGDHSEESVYEDFLAWEPHLAERAFVLFDDWGTPRNPGVEAACERLRPHFYDGDYDVHAGRVAVAIVAPS